MRGQYRREAKLAKTPAVKKQAKTASKKPVRRSIGRPSAKGGVGRDSLIETTCELLRTLPPNEVTRIGVARKANVDPSLIKYYFRDRSSLLLAAAERLMDQSAEAVREAAAAAGNTAEGRLRARVSALLALNTDYPFFHRLIMDEVVNSHQPSARKMLRGMSERRLAGYSGIIQAGQDEGTLRNVDPFFLSIAIIGMAEFFASSIEIRKEAFGEDLDDTADRARYSDFIIDLLLNGLRRRPEDGARVKKPAARAAKPKAAPPKR